MVIKKVRFNYFAINLAPDELPENMQGRNISVPWDMRPLLDYLAVRTNQIQGEANVGLYIAEFDRDTFIYDTRNEIFSFQISKLRENNIPALKRIGFERENIALGADQFIGEFVTIVFDPIYYTVGVQSNLYSLNVGQVEEYLTQLRRRFKIIEGDEDATPLSVELEPLIDHNKIQTLRNSEIFRKITIKGSDYAAEALAQQGTVNEVSEIIGRTNGVNFELTLSVGPAPKSETLDIETIQEIIEGFNNIEGDENKPKIEITAREDIESPIEVVNLLSPRLTNVIPLDIANRMAIGHEYIHQEFVEHYLIQRPIIARVNRPINL